MTAQNEAAQPGLTFVIHTQRPAFCARALFFSTPDERTAWLDEYQPTYAVALEKANVLLYVVQFWGEVTELKPGLLDRMSHWYYHTQLKPPPAGKSPVAESED